ncbi:MAG: phosphatidylserine decarboxylase [Gemmatimonadota bacterium]|nr:phosphatidylserine decarboxylase [Gemmatimonadota bacterium]
MDDGFEIRYRDRRTGRTITEPLSYTFFQRAFQSSFVLGLFHLLLNNSIFCRFYGWMQARPGSRRKISRFVRDYRINVEEIEYPLERYPNFNAFFTRRLRPDARPFVPEPDALSCPADGKVLVFQQLREGAQIPVKGAPVPLERLLDSEEEALPYRHGSALVVRLAPYDYHRFHFPDAGKAGPARVVAGRYYIVNPLGLRRVPGVFWRNRRAVTRFDSNRFGRIAYLEIGGFAVGSIVETYTPGPVERGQEKGYFQFGGSTLVLLFEPGTVVFDDDLKEDSGRGIEVHVRAGSRIGRRVVK